jgi:hypothetical protein
MNRYDTDVLAWANEQAAFIRAGRFALVDREHIADEIEDVGKSEVRELSSRLSVLLAHLLKWQYEPSHRGSSWEITIKTQRRAIQRHIKQVPSLKSKLNDSDWLESVWDDALALAAKETGLDCFPETCTWSLDQIFSTDFWPQRAD